MATIELQDVKNMNGQETWLQLIVILSIDLLIFKQMYKISSGMLWDLITAP